MNIFKTFTLKWWQASLFKISMIALGLAIGANWNEVFFPFINILTIVAIICGLYVFYVWLKQ